MNKEDPEAEKKFQELNKAYEVLSLHFFFIIIGLSVILALDILISIFIFHSRF